MSLQFINNASLFNFEDYPNVLFRIKAIKWFQKSVPIYVTIASVFSKGRVKEIGKIKRVRIIKRSRTRTKGKDKASSENKGKWRKPRLAWAGARP